jgi:serine/threonine protein kinase/tetratricopeptide (TPR) repeat protein
MMDLCRCDPQLSRLLEDQLHGGDHASIVAHVETCAACQARLEELTSDSSLLIHRERFEGCLTGSWSRGAVAEAGMVGDSVATGGHLPAVPQWDPADPIDRNAAAVGGYDIVAKLGHGGMGVVYKARQRGLNRFVALKMIRAGSLARPEDIARLRIEAEAIARLRHPNIIQIFDIGECGGLPFVTLELLEGGSLDARLTGTPQPAAHVAPIVITLARAIDAAHHAGIVHRDLKPSNVLFGADGVLRITDFGLAKRLEQNGHTESGQVLGSPSYIPPEQARGETKDVGPAADIYALGAILYQMLTGRPPFKGTTPVETVMQVLHEDPLPPSRLQSRVPRDLETICLKCLAKEPAKRYPSAGALADDLERFLRNQPILARPTPLWERGVKWTKRRPLTLAVMIAVFVLIASSTAAGLKFHLDRRAQFEHHAQRIAELREGGERALTKTRDAFISGRDNVDETLYRLLPDIEREPQLADLRARTTELLETIGRSRAERAAVQATDERYRDFRRRRDETIFRDTQATDFGGSGGFLAVRNSARDALALFTRVDPATGRCTLVSLPPSLSNEEQQEVVEGCYELFLVLAAATAQPVARESESEQGRRALRILESAAPLLGHHTHAFHLLRAACLERAGDPQEAANERSAARETPPESAFDEFLTGLDWYKRDRLKEAKQHFDAALRLQPGHFWARCLSAICDLNARPPRSAEAKANLTACLQAKPDCAWLYLLRGFAYAQMGTAAANRGESEILFGAAEDDYGKVAESDPDHVLRYGLLANRGLLRFQRVKLTDAITDLNDAIALEPHHYLAYVTLARVYREQHLLAQAMKQLDQAITLEPRLASLYRTRALWTLEGDDPPQRARTAALADLARAIQYAAQGSRETARDHAKRAQLLLLDGRALEALSACNTALQIEPDNADGHRWRVAALLELKRYDEVIDSCNRYLRAGDPSARLLELRGLAKAKRNDFPGAIDDYTQALVLEPAQAQLHARRGWAYLVSGASQLALHDFDEAIRLDPSSSDAHSGSGSAQVLLGRIDEARREAEESLRHGDRDARMLYNAARIYAQAAGQLAARAGRAGRQALAPARRCEERALELLGRALEETEAPERATFWKDVVQSDQALSAIRRLPAFTQLGARYTQQTP